MKRITRAEVVELIASMPDSVPLMRLYSASGYHCLCEYVAGGTGLSDMPEAGSTLREISAYLHGVKATATN